jgi:hypothetical protein
MMALASTGDLIPSQFVDGHLKDYSQEERQLIEDDLSNIAKLCLRNTQPVKDTQPIYVATAGGPGATKSTILETYLQDQPNFVYADPDPRALKFMINTYVQSLNYYAISQASSYQDLLKAAYNKWRAASNYIACKVINEAFAKGNNIAHGTTSTAKEVSGLYERLKGKNYKIVLLLCGSTDQNRLDSIQYRSETQSFIQASPEDIIQKGKAFPERFSVYFQYADEIHLYWTQDFKKGSVKAATFDKIKGMTVHNQQAYECFVEQYPTLKNHF